MLDITIRDQTPVELAALPHRGPYTGIGATFARLCPRLDATGVPYQGPAHAVYYDPKAVPGEDLRSHAGVVIDTGTPLPPGFDRVGVPGGRVAVLLHKGPYEGIAGAWDDLYRWLGTSGEEEADAPSFDRYLNGPEEVGPAELLTELCIPLKG